MPTTERLPKRLPFYTRIRRRIICVAGDISLLRVLFQFEPHGGGCMSHGYRFDAIADAAQRARWSWSRSARAVWVLLACLIGSVAFADTLRCDSTIAPAGPDPDGGYLAIVKATCNQTTYGIALEADSVRSDGKYAVDGGEFICWNASTCSGIAHYTCMPP